MKEHKQRAYEGIKKKGLVPIEILNVMTFDEMLEHILKYLTIGELWYPGLENRS